VACYGRGFIPTSSYWATVGALANGDPFAAAKLLFVYSRLTFDGLSRSLQDTATYVKQKATKFEL